MSAVQDTAPLAESNQAQASPSSFYAAMRILPAAQRDAMFLVYSFCRKVDDIADSDLPAERKRTELYHRVRQFMERHEFLILPVSQVPPFDVKQPYITEINGIKMGTYIDWMKSCYYVTVTGLPAISVPAGFTPEGLPVGIQIVGRHQDDFGVLQLAHDAVGWLFGIRRRADHCDRRRGREQLSEVLVGRIRMGHSGIVQFARPCDGPCCC